SLVVCRWKRERRIGMPGKGAETRHSASTGAVAGRGRGDRRPAVAGPGARKGPGCSRPGISTGLSRGQRTADPYMGSRPGPGTGVEGTPISPGKGADYLSRNIGYTVFGALPILVLDASTALPTGGDWPGPVKWGAGNPQPPRRAGEWGGARWGPAVPG